MNLILVLSIYEILIFYNKILHVWIKGSIAAEMHAESSYLRLVQQVCDTFLVHYSVQIIE